MDLDEFLRQYEAALATQDWDRVAPWIHEDACVTFSTGEVHRGKEAVRRGFERNFAAIQGDTYSMSNVHWVRRSEDVAVYTFDFSWSGVIDGRPASTTRSLFCRPPRRLSRSSRPVVTPETWPSRLRANSAISIATGSAWEKV